MPGKKRGLANVDKAHLHEISVAGGLAAHNRGRGLQTAPEEIRRAVAEKGSRASKEKRRQRKFWAEIL